jgi:hypothetical protein
MRVYAILAAVAVLILTAEAANLRAGHGDCGSIAD